MAAETRIVRVRIEGRVQGVNYRAWTQETAKTLGIDGWVRNLADGSVEALFAGAPALVEAMLERCRSGPRMSRVTQVRIVEEGGEAPLLVADDKRPLDAGFAIRPSV